MTSDWCVLTVFNISPNSTRKYIINVFIARKTGSACEFSCSIVVVIVLRVSLRELPAAPPWLAGESSGPGAWPPARPCDLGLPVLEAGRWGAAPPRLRALWLVVEATGCHCAPGSQCQCCGEPDPFSRNFTKNAQIHPFNFASLQVKSGKYVLETNFIVVSSGRKEPAVCTVSGPERAAAVSEMGRLQPVPMCSVPCRAAGGPRVPSSPHSACAVKIGTLWCLSGGVRI